MRKFSLFLFWLFLLTMLGGSREKTLLIWEGKVSNEKPQALSAAAFENRNLTEDVRNGILQAERGGEDIPEEGVFSEEGAPEIDLEDLEQETVEENFTEAATVETEPEETVGAEILELPTGSSGEAVVAASEKAAKSMYCEGKAAHLLEIGAFYEKKVLSLDDYYYLLRVDPITEAVAMQPVSRLSKAEKIVFQLDTTGHPEYVQSKFCIAVRTGVGYARVSPILTVSRPELLAENTAEYQLARTKKGIQELEIEEVLETGSKQVFLNIPVSEVLPLEPGPVSFVYDGDAYLFNNMQKLQEQVRQFNANEVVVTAQILLNRADVNLILKEARAGSCPFYTWNTREEAPRKKMEAIFSYLGEIFGQEDCYITNWILGNEINSCNSWNYAGKISGKTFITVYCEAFQALYKAVRSRKSGTKVFLCLDHNWNIAPAGYSSKAVLDAFAKVIRSLQPDIQWNLAYHAYPSPLTDVAFWKNKVSNDLNSSIIHMGNLQVLTNYVRDTYGSGTRILLSEQGFTSSQGEPLQAAALCYAYYIAACNPMVDGFHIRSLQDNDIEASQGLMMGIQGKEAYEVYCHMDEVETLTYTTPYISLTGMLSWNEIPNYAPERLHTNYREE